MITLSEWWLHAGCTTGQLIFLSTVTSRIVLGSIQLHLLCIPRRLTHVVRMVIICQPDCVSSHPGRPNLNNSFYSFTPVKGDKTTDWVGLRACLNIERERDMPGCIRTEPESSSLYPITTVTAIIASCF